MQALVHLFISFCMIIPPPLSVVQVQIQAHVDSSRMVKLNSFCSLGSADITIGAQAHNSYCNNMVHKVNSEIFILFTIQFVLIYYVCKERAAHVRYRLSCQTHTKINFDLS
jgi:hypothetical protein